MKTALTIVILLISGTLLRAQDIQAYSAEDVMNRCTSKDTIYVVNFWATWCVPCVQELPEFNLIQSRYAKLPVKVLLVSLDFKEDRSYKLRSFLDRKHISPEVVWLSDTNPNEFVPKINNTWQGSIPATMIIAPKTEYKKFIEGMITEREVSAEVDKLLK